MKVSHLQPKHPATAGKRPIDSDMASPGQLRAAPPFQLQAGAAAEGSPALSGTLGGLPTELLHGFANVSGHDLSDVKVHRNSGKPAQVGALAYAQGNEIHLAAGQEQHLAHEAAHIVQQREGRVQATTQFAGKAVNDCPGLEADADAMGARAMQMKAAPTQQLKMGAGSDVAQCKAVLQRKVSTWGGDFEAVNYHPIDGDAQETHDRKEIRFLNMDLEFEANDKVDAQKIALTQTSVTFRTGEIRNKDHTSVARSIPEGNPGEGAHIDQYSDNISPLYAVQDAQPKDKHLKSTKPHETWGDHGYRYKNWKKDVQSKKATLKDKPGPEGFLAPNSKQEFESTALAISGKQKGLYYGSVRWGWETNDDNEFSVIPLHAAELWNGSETSENHKTLPLPLPGNVKVALADLELRDAPQNGGLIQQLANGTRFEDLQDTDHGMAKVKVIDGAGNHDVMYREGWVSETLLKNER
jgi:hypothetical protein